MAGKLYVVATPLGNLEDITQRALRILGEVDLIAAEDTRHSRKLLQHYGIHTSMTSYYDETERRKAPLLVERMLQGKNVALISDAGTPGIADPGYHLVCAAVAAGIRVEPIPGASAVAAALSASALPTDRFVFEGFVPAKAVARAKFLQRLVDEERTIVAYEAARRLVDCLADVHAILGNRRITVARELTKMFEEILRGEVEEVLAGLRERAQHLELPGEITLVISGRPSGPRTIDPQALQERIRSLRATGHSLKEISRMLAQELGMSARDLYQIGLRIAAAD